MEMRPAIHDRFGVFGHAVVEHFHGIILRELNGVEIACAKAAPAADAMGKIHRHLAGFRIKNEAVVRALAAAAAATAAERCIDAGLAVGVLFRFACAGAAAHADVLNCTAKPGGFMAFEVGKADEYIGIHNGAPDLGFLYIFATFYGHGNIVCALEAIAD